MWPHSAACSWELGSTGDVSLGLQEELSCSLLGPVLVRGPPCPCGDGLRRAHVLQQNEVMRKTKLYLLEKCDKAKDRGHEKRARVSCYMHPCSRSLGKA